MKQPASQHRDPREALTQTGPDTDMGRLLRKFWHPVALSRDVANGSAIPVRLFGEEFTLYRGQTGTAHLIGGRCRHRRTVLHTGWVEGDEIRCMYHGWKYDGSGRCTERPAENDEKGVPEKCKIPGHAVHEYAGLIFAYVGAEPAPAFDLPRKDCLEGRDVLIVATKETWAINWFQQIENSLDPVHVSFVHQTLRVGEFGRAVTTNIPELSYIETEAGLEQTAKRPNGNVRKSDWTFPNNNHVVVPGMQTGDPWIDFVIWMVPADDQHSTRFTLYALKPTDEAQTRRFLGYFEKFGSYNADEHYHELFFEKKPPPEEDFLAGLISAQDYIAQRGQGVITDRAEEMLGRSDLGVITLRRIFYRELQAVRDGAPTKAWGRRPHVGVLPTPPGRPAASAAAAPA
jgi:5,5'-dehydrodivanillate O-demethylase